MNTSCQVLRQKVGIHIISDKLFRDRWTSNLSLAKAVSCRYKLEGITTTKLAISKAVGKLDTSMDDLTIKNLAGVYSGRFNTDRYFFFQKPSLDPPYFPPTNTNNTVWNVIKSVDKRNVEIYLANIEKLQSRVRVNKRKRLDSIDIYDNISTTSDKTKKGVVDDAKKIIGSIPSNNYWNSPDANHLFMPRNDETVLEAFVRRDKLLAAAAFDNDVLMTMFHNVDDIHDLTNTQLLNVKLDCLYLKKGYEIALQRMNQLTWTDCLILAIKDLADIGILPSL